MHRVRLLLFLSLVLAVGATSVAMGQDETSVYHDQSQKQERDGNKAKANNNDGHRKHWWSMPHFHHKKHQNDSVASSGPDATKMVAQNAPGKSAAPAVAPKVAVTNAARKTASPAKPGNKTAHVTRTAHKTTAAARHSNKTVVATHARRKTVASASHGRKIVRHNCSTEDA
ncbi:MAG: hypothetical protein ACRD4F_04050, partial [Candidatus Angelobacter sp.]